MHKVIIFHSVINSLTIMTTSTQTTQEITLTMTINSFGVPTIIISKNSYANFMTKLDIHQKSINLDPRLLLHPTGPSLKQTSWLLWLLIQVIRLLTIVFFIISLLIYKIFLSTLTMEAMKTSSLIIWNDNFTFLVMF